MRQNITGTKDALTCYLNEVQQDGVSLVHLPLPRNGDPEEITPSYAGMLLIVEKLDTQRQQGM